MRVNEKGECMGRWTSGVSSDYFFSGYGILDLSTSCESHGMKKSKLHNSFKFVTWMIDYYAS